MTKCGETIKNMLLGLAGTVVMICLAVSLTVWFRPLYYFDIDYLDIPQSSGVSAELCRLNYDALIDYNVPGGSAKLMFPTMPMSESGRKTTLPPCNAPDRAFVCVSMARLLLVSSYILRKRSRENARKKDLTQGIVAVGQCGTKCGEPCG